MTHTEQDARQTEWFWLPGAVLDILAAGGLDTLDLAVYCVCCRAAQGSAEEMPALEMLLAAFGLSMLDLDNRLDKFRTLGLLEPFTADAEVIQ
jgi:hypothetical protein